MNIVDWAKNELAIIGKQDSCEYMKACGNSALKALIILANDGHSGMSIGATKNILNRLIDFKPLTPLTGDDDEWSICSTPKIGITTYQNKRCSSVFKDVFPDGKVVYNDIDRVCCIDVTSNVSYHMGGSGDIWDRIFGHISMPYTPSDNPIIVYTDDFLYDEKNGDFDHKAMLYGVLPDGTKVTIDEYMQDDESSKTGWRYISKEEYLEHRKDKIIIHSDLQEVQKAVDKLDSAKDISDGYHTFDELYYHRMILFSVICNTYPNLSWKSKIHDDGTMYDDMFIVGITTPEGDYTYHYHLKDWDKFQVKELSTAHKWDGHKPKDILRLRSIIDM